VVVVDDGGGHWNTHTCSSGHGANGEHDSVAHWPLAMVRHFPSGGGGHWRVQNSFGWVQGWRGEQDSSVHWRARVSKHFPVGGGGHAGTQSWFAGHGAVGEQEPLHCAVVGSRQVPLGSGGGHLGTQTSMSGSRNAPPTEQGWTGEHAALHCFVLRLKHVPVGSGGGHCGTQNWFGSEQG
jgi:hypothetical protein